MSGARPELLPAATRVAVPWKNGGGLTREVCAEPAGSGLEAFDWRISTAEVAAGGPFSSFPGIDRTLCILRGELRLQVAGQGEHCLGADSAPLRFHGESPAYADPIGGAVVDLNVMARRGRSTAQVTRRAQPGLFGTEAATAVLYALEPLLAVHGGARYPLAAHDALRAGPGTELHVSGARVDFYLIELSVGGGST